MSNDERELRERIDHLRTTPGSSTAMLATLQDRLIQKLDAKLTAIREAAAA